MEAALPDDHGVPDGDSAFQQFGKILLPMVGMASKFSDHGSEVIGPHKVLNEDGPAHELLSEELQTARTQA